MDIHWAVSALPPEKCYVHCGVSLSYLLACFAAPTAVPASISNFRQQSLLAAFALETQNSSFLLWSSCVSLCSAGPDLFPSFHMAKSHNFLCMLLIINVFAFSVGLAQARSSSLKHFFTNLIAVFNRWCL